MNNRIMIKLSASEGCISLRTVSRGFRSPHRFILLEKELRELEVKKYHLAMDIRSFAELHLEKDTEGRDTDILEIRFIWLSDVGKNKLSGTEEILRFPWQAVKESIEKSRSLKGAAVGLLSMGGNKKPKIEFHSRRNLKAVVEKRVLRKKLGRFLGCHFTCDNGGRIMVFDDFEPYSFFFREERPAGTGMCGGIILHGRENLKEACYEIHT
ncbi:MAG: hypothetical protein HFH89_07080 [Lachnospiraceae bacterium]|nr:hypothetical protein [uncultured Acetatifactor sp.]MCI8287403.1 hypothetical protein [Lachnospiraceae bacterium]